MLHKLHLSRRIQHALTGLILLLISHLLPPYPHGFILLLLATLAFHHIHKLRLQDASWDEWYLQKFGGLLRSHEIGEWEWEHHHSESSDDSKNVTKKSNSAKGDNNNNIIITMDNKQQQRKKKRKTPPALPGAFYFLLGTTITTFIFASNLEIARTALLVLSLADPMAGLVGVTMSNLHISIYGVTCNCTWECLFHKLLKGLVGNGGVESSRKDTPSVVGGPTIAGSVACALTTVLCTYAYIPTAGVASTSLTTASRICVGIITAFVEAASGRQVSFFGCKFKVVDDNLLIPLVVGTTIHWLSY